MDLSNPCRSSSGIQQRHCQPSGVPLHQPRRPGRHRIEPPQPVGLLLTENLRPGIRSKPHPPAALSVLPRSLHPPKRPLSIHSTPSISCQLLPPQKHPQFPVPRRLIRHPLREVVAEHQRREIPQRRAGRRQVSDDAPAQSRSDGLHTQGIARAFDGRLRVDIG